MPSTISPPRAALNQSSAPNPDGTCSLPRLRPVSATRGPNLAHLVSKFEVLDALASTNQPAQPRPGSISGHSRQRMTPAGFGEPVSPSPAAVSSMPVLSVSAGPGSVGASSGDFLPRRVPSPILSDHSSTTKSSMYGLRPNSIVAERRMFFESVPSSGNLDEISTTPRQRPDNVQETIQITPSWQTLRAISPASSSRSVQTAQQDYPSSAKHSSLASKCLPTTKTCPAVFHCQDAQSGCWLMDDKMQDDAISEAAPSALAANTGPVDSWMQPWWQSRKRRHAADAPGTMTQTPTEGGNGDMPTTASVGDCPNERPSPSSAKSSSTIRVMREAKSVSTPAQGKINTHSPIMATFQKRLYPLRTSIPSLSISIPKKRHGASPGNQVQASTRLEPSSSGFFNRSPTPQDYSNDHFSIHDGSKAIRIETSDTPKSWQLQDTIGLFESLNRQQTREETATGNPGLTINMSDEAGDSINERLSCQKRRVGLGSALGKLSGSWGRRQPGRLAGRTRQMADENVSGSKTNGKRTSPHIYGKIEGLSGMFEPNSVSRDLVDMNVGLPTAAISTMDDLFPASWHDRTHEACSANVSHERGTLGNNESFASDLLTRVLDGASDAVASRTESRARLSRSEPEALGKSNNRMPSRRWTLRGSDTVVAQVRCTLEQPRPRRANEMRRLVSLCKDRVTVWKGKGHTE
ncbi:hypothetical protein DCS_05160 [Drechmeria coniospora]|uniref:Uncharacterized protein n=1 Tax=Drechmeria coniospora TaxID=98403 RepID=A0A151GM15_DRECN|nr:hypothetical protein DCS_05160 [Drechmeria coniospora]KYK58147.1 hypothetical protein DCS_05160 [Drechmeria coniospora]